ncbi:Uncharacterised protein [uncultured archaeon]|nr:Uncharacterised protein [uncultured archaeon]
MRKCIKCDLEKLEEDFYKSSRGSKLMTLCKGCLKLYVKNRAREQKKKAVKLLGGKCSRCGYSRCLGALEFHHTEPENKIRDVHDFRFYNWEAFWFEAKKCILLCANCHREEEERLSPA